jgi:hypothetical protein
MIKKRYFSNQSNRYAVEEKQAPMFSYGLAVPKSGGLEACLCADKLTYSKKCCKGFLINQGIGQTISPYPQPHPIAFSNGFSDGFF